MRNRSIAVLAVATIAVVAPCCAWAEEAAPQPPAEMANLAVFSGTWSCAGTTSPSPMGPAGKITSKVEGNDELGGFWRSGTVTMTGEGMPGAMKGVFRMTYDPGAKQYVLLWADSMGAWSQATSPGWEGDKIVFTGEGTMGGQKMTTRDSFAKGSDGTLRHDWEAQLDGKWTPLGTETCRKGA